MAPIVQSGSGEAGPKLGVFHLVIPYVFIEHSCYAQQGQEALAF